MALVTPNRAVLFRRRRSWESGGTAPAFFAFSPLTTVASLGGTFTRAGSAVYYDTSGVVQTATTGVIRNGHFLGGVQHVLLEPARTNQWLQSQDMSQAAVTKTLCTIATGKNDPAGGTTACGIITNNGAQTSPGVSEALAATANNGELFSFFVSSGNKSQVCIDITDLGSTHRRSWVNTTTGAVGTLGSGCTIKTWALSNSFYRVELQLGSSSTPTGNITWLVGPADADNSTTCTGDGATVNINVWGFQQEKDVPSWPSSYIATAASSVSRVIDVLTFPWSDTTNLITMYANMTEIGSLSNGSTTQVMAELGPNNGAASKRLSLFANNVTDSYKSLYDGDAAHQVLTSGAVTQAAIGNQIEVRPWVETDFTTHCGTSINGAAETFDTASAAGVALSPPWQGSLLALGNSNTANGGLCAFRNFKILKGANVSLALCRAG